MSRKSLLVWLIILPDIVWLYLSLWLAMHIRYGSGLASIDTGTHYRTFSIIFALWLLVFFIHGLFDAVSFRRLTALILNLVSAMSVSILVAIVYFYFQPNLILTPRRFLLLEAGIAFGLVLVWHLILKYAVVSRLKQNLYLFSFNNELSELEKEIKSHDYLGYKVLDHLNEQTLDTSRFSAEDGIILPENLNTRPEVLEKFYKLRIIGVKFYNYREFYELLLRRVYLSQINEAWFLENVDYQEKRFYNIVKRLVDIVFGVIGFAIFAVSFPFVALLIKLQDSNGPVLFIQERAGKKGDKFKVYKYRTMKAGTATNTWTSVNDSRITKVGKFLRTSRIDEWPQFINLILGHISLVGPRPEQPHLVEDLKKQIPFYDERHLVKPGITGWAQINNTYAGNHEETKLKLQYDLYYIKNRGFLFDLEIILKTMYYIFTWQGR